MPTSTGVGLTLCASPHCEVFAPLIVYSRVVSLACRFSQKRKNTLKDCELPRTRCQLLPSGEGASTPGMDYISRCFYMVKTTQSRHFQAGFF